jgi:hypothetical protein
VLGGSIRNFIALIFGFGPFPAIVHQVVGNSTVFLLFVTSFSVLLNIQVDLFDARTGISAHSAYSQYERRGKA